MKTYKVRPWALFLALFTLAGCQALSIRGKDKDKDLGDMALYEARLDVSGLDVGDVAGSDLGFDGRADGTTSDAAMVDLLGADLSPCQGVPLEFGCACESDAECGSGMCITESGSSYCTRECGECPTGYVCAGTHLTKGVVVYQCVRDADLCVPCGLGGACKEGECAPKGLVAGCVWRCTTEKGCPGMQTCLFAGGSDSEAGYCVPPSRDCLCTGKHHGQHGPCEKTNEYGTCKGHAKCNTSLGWIECDAVEPAEELCDGADNDCDGIVDEGAACDDGNPCTLDVCTPGGECEYQAVADAVVCEDGDPCTGPDTCLGVACVAGAVRPACQSTCGDGVCAGTENPTACPLDCGACGDGVCGVKEQDLVGIWCPADCASSCGDGTCEGGETALSCQVDCGFCGDGVCGAKETGSQCSADCPATCGNQVCEPEEDAVECPYDCPAVCGDGVCGEAESPGECGADCKVCGDGLCSEGEEWGVGEGYCAVDCAPAFCGDQICSVGKENEFSCPVDCGRCGDGWCGMLEDLHGCPADCQAGCDAAACDPDSPLFAMCASGCLPPPEWDGDAVPPVSDNCATSYNPTQLDTDNDGIGNVCDPDDDGDGDPDATDCAPTCPMQYHGGVEICDGYDNDCSGVVDDGDLCNDLSECLFSVCAGASGCYQYVVADACDDGNPCTLDSCVGSLGCSHSNKSDGAACGKSGFACKTGVCQCLPNCGGKECGPDGCGGLCGECSAAEICTDAGVCVCIPFCSGKQCGSDGCGGSCGSCLGQLGCTAEGTCACGPMTWQCGAECCDFTENCYQGKCCTPNCSGKSCGDDGCGGTCGTCPNGQLCKLDGTCHCIPDCNGKECDSDGCVGTCGSCGAGEECISGVCLCIPSCDGKVCGADGCGGVCGWCGVGEQCVESACQAPVTGTCQGSWCAVEYGQFTMGALVTEQCANQADELEHSVILTSPYLIGEYEVTRADFRKVMGVDAVAAGGCVGESCPVTQMSWWDVLWFANLKSQQEGLTPCYQFFTCTGTPGQGCASDDCMGTFSCLGWELSDTCDGYRLPTEAEWERAVRNGDRGPLPYGGTFESSQGCDACYFEDSHYAYAWLCSTSEGLLHAVGQLWATSLGLYDVLGNAAEWVYDGYQAHVSGTQQDPIGQESNPSRVLKGGSYKDFKGMGRLSARTSLDALSRRADVGFRLARTLPKPCVPNCADASCGDDGCGGSCGTCTGGDYCTERSCVPYAPFDAGAQFVLLTDGTFQMGSPGSEGCHQSDELLHPVTLTRDILMGLYEVSQDRYTRVMGQNPSDPAVGVDTALPVQNLTFFDALSYCNAISIRDGLETCYTLSGCVGTPGAGMMCTGVEFWGLDCPGWRLPTEAEWEYAARAGGTLAYGYYNSPAGADESFCSACLVPSVLGSAVFGCGNSTSGPQYCVVPAGNAYGLSGMLGNVAEMVWDRYAGYAANGATDPQGGSFGSKRVVRGGHFQSLQGELRCAARKWMNENDTSPVVGFRVARTVIYNNP